MGFLSKLFHAEDPLAPQIWACEPLVVWSEEKGVAYAGNTDAEYTPDEAGRGTIRVLTPGDDGWTPDLTITGRQEPLNLGMYGVQFTGGRTLFGNDSARDSYTWYIGSDASEFLVSLAKA